jgi:hypothetical protein
MARRDKTRVEVVNLRATPSAGSASSRAGAGPIVHQPMVKTDLCQLARRARRERGGSACAWPDRVRKDDQAPASRTRSAGHDAWVEGNESFVGIEVLSADVYAKPA